MSKIVGRDEPFPVEGQDPVGIVVQGGGVDRKRPRAVAFFWGPDVSPAPSLPFGRWKTDVLSAA